MLRMPGSVVGGVGVSAASSRGILVSDWGGDQGARASRAHGRLLVRPGRRSAVCRPRAYFLEQTSQDRRDEPVFWNRHRTIVATSLFLGANTESLFSVSVLRLDAPPEIKHAHRRNNKLTLMPSTPNRKQQNNNKTANRSAHAHRVGSRIAEKQVTANGNGHSLVRNKPGRVARY
jgi:hypothetical protein